MKTQMHKENNGQKIAQQKCGKITPEGAGNIPFNKRWASLLTFYIEEISTESASKHVQAMCK